MRDDNGSCQEGGEGATAVGCPTPTEEDRLFTALVLDSDSLTDEQLLGFIPRSLRRTIRELKPLVEASHVTTEVTAPTPSGTQKLVITALVLPLLGRREAVVLPDGYVATAIGHLLDRWFLEGMRSGKMKLWPCP